MEKEKIYAKLSDVGAKIGVFTKIAAEKTTEIAQATAKASKETIAVGKMNIKIAEEKGYIKQKYEKIGNAFYDKYKDDVESVPEELKDLFLEISVGFETIKLYEDKIVDIKSGIDINEYEEEIEGFEFGDEEITADDIDTNVVNIVPVTADVVTEVVEEEKQEQE